MKRNKKKVSPSKRKKGSAHLVVGYTIVTFGVLSLFLFASIGFKWVQNNHVLGMSTLLAEGGSGSGQSGGGESGSNSQETHDSTSPEVHTNPTGAPINTEEHTQTGSGVTLINCTVPDHKTFQTSAINCARYNEFWRHQTHSTSESGTTRPPRPTGTSENEIHRGKPGHELGDDNDIKVEQNGDDDFVLRQGSIGARTRFPLSLNPNTGQLTVTTPHGTKDVTVLPDEAVQNLLDKHIITNLDDTTPNASSSVSLDEKNNAPVFIVNGESKQHLFGFIPVTIHKSVDVSVQTGEVVSENESFSERFFDLLSF